MADVFSDAGNLFLTAVFFQPIMPFAIPIALIGFVLQYWVNKVTLEFFK